MENVYAAMLLHKAEKEINEENVTNVLTAAGITVDAVQIKALVASLSEVDIDEAIKAAPTMMAAAPAAPAAAQAAEKKSSLLKEFVMKPEIKEMLKNVHVKDMGKAEKEKVVEVTEAPKKTKPKKTQRSKV